MGFVALALGMVLCACGDDETSGAEAVFRDRILPIFRSTKPSSCTECHLGAVDLKDYISRDQGRTFASLREAGLIDMKNPDGSQILTLIRMAPEKSSPLTREMREQEFQAFRAWIRSAVKDPELAKAKVEGKPALPEAPVEVIRHGRKDRLLRSFIENVWSERLRCWNCHGPDVPKLPKPRAKKEAWIEEYGANVMIWMRGKTPAEAMDRILASRIIDLREPARSLILTKPTTQVKHEGGKKMAPGDRAYRQFLRFIEDYTAVRSGAYRSEADLPGIIKTRQWMRVRGVPVEKWAMMQVDLHRVEGGRPSREPFARAVGAAVRGVMHAPVDILGSRAWKDFGEIAGAGKLPPGVYQLRFYVDHRNRLKDDPATVFGPADVSGMMQINAAGWPEDDHPLAEMVRPKDRTAREFTFPRRGR